MDENKKIMIDELGLNGEASVGEMNCSPDSEKNSQEALVEEPQEIPGIVFSFKECIFAWLCFFAGYLVCRAIPVAANPLGSFLVIALLFIVTGGFLIAKGFKLNVSSVLSAVAAITVSASLVLSGDRELGSWSFFFGVILYTHFVYSATGNHLDGAFSNFLAGDFFKALFVLPFRSFGDIFRAAFSSKSTDGIKAAGKVLLGLAVAIIPTAIVIVLLSYDSDFSNLIAKVFEFNIGDVISHIGSVIAGVPLGMYAFGLYSSAVNNKCKDMVTKEGIEKAGQKCRFAPALTVCAAVVPLLTVYGVFFVSQWKYYVSGFKGVLPDEFSYAEYAKEGFFQLCAVSVINFVIIIAATLFIKRKEDKSPLALKIITVLFAASTLVLVSTAIAKMVMYIENYGLTRKRVLSSVFMVALALVFILITVKQFAPKFKVVPISAIVCMVLFAALALSNINNIIVGYNVDRYLSGDHEKFDVNATYELGYSAVPELVELATVLDEKYGGEIASERLINADEKTEKLYKALKSRLKFAAGEIENENNDVFSFDVSKMRVKAALQKIGYDC